MAFIKLPSSAAWRHQETREGFETVFLVENRTGYQLRGHAAAVEDGQPWAVRYVITLDERWATRAARIWSWSEAGEQHIQLEGDGAGHWTLDSSLLAELEGCFDIDLESSVCTNTIPVHRLRLEVGQSSEVPALYVRAPHLRVERLEQTYLRATDRGAHQRYDYCAPRFGAECRLVYDAFGLVVVYPGLATRVR